MNTPSDSELRKRLLKLSSTDSSYDKPNGKRILTDVYLDELEALIQAELLSQGESIQKLALSCVPKELNWNSKEQKQFSMDKTHALLFMHAYNSAIQQMKDNIKKAFGGKGE